MSRRVDSGLLGMFSDFIQNISVMIVLPFQFLWKFLGKPRLTRVRETGLSVGLNLASICSLMVTVATYAGGEEEGGGRYYSHSLWSALATRSLLFRPPPLSGQDLVKEGRLPFRGVNSIPRTCDCVKFAVELTDFSIVPLPAARWKGNPLKHGSPAFLTLKSPN